MFLKHLFDEFFLSVYWPNFSLGPASCNIYESSRVSTYLLKWGAQNWVQPSMVDWQLKGGDTIITQNPYPESLLFQYKTNSYLAINWELMYSHGQLTTFAFSPQLLSYKCLPNPILLVLHCINWHLPLLNFTSLVLARGSFLSRTFWILILLSFKVTSLSRCASVECFPFSRTWN